MMTQQYFGRLCIKMPKPRVTESRFDFRGGRVSAISPDLLNANELVDATNTRLVNSYGAFGKRLGSQRIHPDALTAAIRGVTQWDISGGKQIVAIANGKLYYRDGFDYSVAFQQATTAATQRTTAALDLPAVGSRGWTDPDGTDNGRNTLTVAINAASQTVAAEADRPRGRALRAPSARRPARAAGDVLPRAGPPQGGRLHRRG